MNQCHVEGCKNEVSKPGHKLCYEHWQDERDGIIIPCKACGKLKDNDYPLCRNCYSKDMADKSESLNKNAKEIGSSKTLTATAIGKELGLRNRKVNQILEELGWIRKEDAGFFPTRQGRENGGIHREHSQSGASYVVWDQAIINNKIFLNSIREFRGEDIEPLATEDTKVEDKTAAFRNAFPATIRTKDGHMVRSRGEALIDNYLYAEKIVHAYEKRLPLADEECFCDFYIPEKRIYIEYWGLEESDDKYAERKRKKLEIYKREKYDLIEITNDMIDSLDDYLPKELKRRGFDVS